MKKIFGTIILATSIFTTTSCDESQLEDILPVDEEKQQVLELNGENVINLPVGTSFVDEGATLNGEESELIVVEGSVDSSTIGSYTLTYSLKDTEISLSRVINIYDDTPVELVFNGAKSIDVERGTTFTDPGVNEVEGYNIEVVSNVDTEVVNTYEIIYKVYNDLDILISQDIRTVNVEDTIAPSLESSKTNDKVYVKDGVSLLYDEPITSYSTDGGASFTQLNQESHSFNLELSDGSYEIIVKDKYNNHSSPETISIDNAAPLILFEEKINEDHTVMKLDYIPSNHTIYEYHVINGKIITLSKENNTYFYLTYYDIVSDTVLNSEKLSVTSGDSFSIVGFSVDEKNMIINKTTSYSTYILAYNIDESDTTGTNLFSSSKSDLQRATIVGNYLVIGKENAYSVSNNHLYFYNTTTLELEKRHSINYNYSLGDVTFALIANKNYLRVHAIDTMNNNSKFSNYSYYQLNNEGKIDFVGNDLSDVIDDQRFLVDANEKYYMERLSKNVKVYNRENNALHLNLNFTSSSYKVFLIDDKVYVNYYSTTEKKYFLEVYDISGALIITKEISYSEYFTKGTSKYLYTPRKNFNNSEDISFKSLTVNELTVEDDNLKNVRMFCNDIEIEFTNYPSSAGHYVVQAEDYLGHTKEYTFYI